MPSPGRKETVYARASRTWRTVTGILTPHSSHMAVIPFFLAMTPVLNDLSNEVEK